jgi:two-component system, sensor histidine kinase and response regulator
MWEIIQDTVQELQPLARYKSVVLSASSDVADPDSLKILGDCQEIRRMIANLAGNALKFTDSGNIEIRLSFLLADEVAANGWVSIETQDTGLGMSTEDQAVIFQRFRTGNHHRAGSGLGLHLVERIVTTHSGTITVISEPGKGSLFKVRLPAHLS